MKAHLICALAVTMATVTINQPAAAQNIQLGDRLIAFADREIGVAETPGPQSSQRVVDYLRAGGAAETSDSVAWCSYFVIWVAKAANAEVGGATGAARSWLTVGEPVEAPLPGDVVIMWRDRRDGWTGHVGFYVGETPDTVLVLGGNQGRIGEVNISKFPKTQVLGYRRLKSTR